MRRLIKNLTKTEVVMALLVLCFILVQVWLDLALPDYMAEITMLVQTQESQMGDILIAGAKMLGCAFGSLLSAVVVALLASRIASNFSYITRKKVFGKIMDFSMKEMNAFSTPSLITRTTNDINQVQFFIVMGLQIIIKAPITAIWAITKIADKSASWTTVTGVAVVVLLVVVVTCLSLAIPRFKRLQVLTDNINRVTREGLEGMNVVRAYNAENYQADKFEQANMELTKTMLFTSKTMSFMGPSIMMIANGLVLSVYLVGAVLIHEAIGIEKMELFSNMVVFSSYAMMVILSFMMLVMVFAMLPRASVAAKRLQEVLETESSIFYGKEKSESKKGGKVEFRNVSFRFEDAPSDVLHNISFVANQGEVVAIIGATGCGKSTLLHLIPRFFDTTEGTILINDQDVKQYEKQSLNDLVGYVSQKAMLFTGTVKDNITFGKEENSPLLSSSLAISQSEEFVQSLENTVEHEVAQGGRNLSGGQKQRLSIARALYRNPKILLFDDSFSALDYQTDKELRHALQKTYKDTTRIIVAQRIGTIKDADTIIVLDEGEIVGMGKHQMLLDTCEVYQQIASSQLSKEELAQ